jgi:hypothetical protein
LYHKQHLDKQQGNEVTDPQADLVDDAIRGYPDMRMVLDELLECSKYIITFSFDQEALSSWSLAINR